ncbi:MAG: hypothetical protein OHM77_00010 [Candidatus Nitricoxidivorans perseverans]|uniref:Uncharacterized protein n=1 Tax=Candidatus Nitricoxidivorans perseverans TaxID=2975601 RepID=A0AA49FKS6_9PROT|nr:MAG: hypothetical protein OHM77_13620 [Candidatus Nitricoxidivorans perseverans]WIM05706.1 MAG: hypothetical protein OHM77_00010 [Candidatus Nitricoxidivorans perseverans]
MADQVRRRAHVYVAHGGKTNRRQQVDRLVIMVDWMQAQFGLTGLAQIGKRQVIAYWKAHRDLAPTTAYAYWLALKVLWSWLGRAEDPPVPFAK